MFWLDLLFSAALILSSTLSALDLSLKATRAYHQAIQQIEAQQRVRS